MKGRNLLALPVLVLAFACESDQPLTGPKSVPFDPSDVIQDGAHGGNPDFWFLPPMVRAPFGHPNFVLGTFNNALGPSLRIEICELRNEHLSALGIPTGATRCKADDTNPNIDAPPIKIFGAGTTSPVNLVNLPRSQHGWWSLFGLPEDGFYYVLWNTRQSNLNVNKYYRIKVLIPNRDGDPPVVLGVADVDPMSSLGQWRHTRTNEVVQMIDDVLLPIPFRVEQGALCEPGTNCTSVTVTNNTDGVDQIVQLDNGSQDPIAGASIPDCVLPGPGCAQEAAPGAPQSFVLNISRVATGGTAGFASNVANISAQSAPPRCHPTLTLKQFEGCFNFTTIPELPPINEAGDVFLNAVTVAVCFELYGNTTDPRVPFVRLFASDPGETPRLLPQASETAILTDPDSRDCTSPVVANSSTGVIGLASAGWRKLQGGFGRLFGVETAYALDVGIAGLVKKISNVGPALVAEIESNSADDNPTVQSGVATQFSARIVGVSHDEGHPSTGIADIPVDFSLSECNGILAGPAPSSPTVFTNVDGVAQVSLTVTSGSCTLTADSEQAMGGPVTFTATVAPATIVSAVSSALSLVANSTANGVLVQDVDAASQNTTLNQLSASVSALSVVGATSVLTQNSAVATWINAASGRVVFTALGWTISAPVGSTDNHAVVANSADWTHTFTATSSGNLTIQYAVTQDPGTTDPFGLQGFFFTFLENGVFINQQNFSVPSAAGTVNQGAVTRPVVAGRTYTVRLWNNANVHFGTYTATAHMSGTFDWSVSPPSIP